MSDSFSYPQCINYNLTSNLQEKQAESQARFAKLGVPIECLPKQQSIFRVFYSHFTSPYRFPQNDACLQHIKVCNNYG
jgi:hypothetical protein